jgi:hypothetical protein
MTTRRRTIGTNAATIAAARVETTSSFYEGYLLAPRVGRPPESKPSLD